MPPGSTENVLDFRPDPSYEADRRSRLVRDRRGASRLDVHGSRCRRGRSRCGLGGVRVAIVILDARDLGSLLVRLGDRRLALSGRDAPYSSDAHGSSPRDRLRSLHRRRSLGLKQIERVLTQPARSAFGADQSHGQNRQPDGDSQPHRQEPHGDGEQWRGRLLAQERDGKTKSQAKRQNANARKWAVQDSGHEPATPSWRLPAADRRMADSCQPVWRLADKRLEAPCRHRARPLNQRCHRAHFVRTYVRMKCFDSSVAAAGCLPLGPLPAGHLPDENVADLSRPVDHLTDGHRSHFSLPVERVGR